MQWVLCWILGHERTTTGAERTCVRCGLRERLRNYGNVRGWEEVARSGRVSKP